MRIVGQQQRYRKYAAARERIREMIKGLDAGTRLASENELAAMLEVSRPTVRKALDELVEGGVLRRLPRRGVYTVDMGLKPLKICYLYRDGPWMMAPFEAVFHRQMQAEVSARGGALISAAADSGDAMQAALSEADGVIVRYPINPGLLPISTPVVVPFFSNYLVPNATYVLVDDYLAGATACGYLTGLGHRRLAYVGHTHQEHFPEVWPQHRHQGVCDAVATLGIAAAPFINRSGDALAPETFAPLLDRGVTAFICSTDETAMAAISCLHRIGAPVPEQVSVIGFDDIPAAATFVPPLTTMRDPVELVVATVIEELAQRIRDPEGSVARKITLPMELVERESCGPAAAEVLAAGCGSAASRQEGMVSAGG